MAETDDSSTPERDRTERDRTARDCPEKDCPEKDRTQVAAALRRTLAGLGPSLGPSLGPGLGPGLDGAGWSDAEAAPPLAPLPPMALARGRVHEFTGSARRTLAAAAAGVAQAEGVVVWLRPGWRSEGLCPQGLAALVPDPGALLMVACPRADDLLWGMEEALRAGCAALVIAEIVDPPDLRQVRRLHMAASDGVARNRQAGKRLPAPLGVLAAHEAADSRVTGVESRWALHPLPPGRGAAPWRLDRLMMRGLPPQEWAVAFSMREAEDLARGTGVARG